MAKNIIILIFITLLIGPNTAFATTWTYLQRQEGTRMGACSEYFDADSVVINEGKLTFWTLWVLDQELQFDNTKKILWKREVLLASPMKNRNVERYSYDSTDSEISRYLQGGAFYNVPVNSVEEESMERVFSYAQGSPKAEAVKPEHIVVPDAEWYGGFPLPDCQFYWNVSSMALWPRDNPTTVEVIVKWVWNPQGIEGRKAALALVKQKPSPTNYGNLSYTLVNYQFSLYSNKMTSLSIIDHDRAGERITFIEGEEWQDCVEGSKEDMARKSILQWMNNHVMDR